MRQDHERGRWSRGWRLQLSSDCFVISRDKVGPCSLEGQKGCFAVSSMREFPILPPEAVGIITRSRSKLKQLIAKNIEVERPKMNADSLAELVLTFFTGLSMEHNLSSSRPSIVRKIDDLMNIVRTL